MRQKGGRGRTIIRRGAVVSTVAILGLLRPVAAQAATTRSAYATAWGKTTYAADANARAEAHAALNSLARSLGEVCDSVTFTSLPVYTVRDGNGYVYGATATGNCAPA